MLDLVANSYFEVLERAAVVVRVGFLPAVIGAASAYITSFIRSLLSADQQILSWLIYGTHRLVFLGCIAAIAVGWHRSIILGEPITTIRPHWKARHTTFWLWSLLLTALAFVPDMAFALFAPDDFSYLAFLLWIPLALSIAYLGARLALALPASAVERSASALQAWRLSTGNGARIAVASVFVLFPAYLVLGLVASSLVDEIQTDSFDLVRSAAIIVVGWLVMPWLTCLEVGILSYSYRQLAPPAV